ncbi:unnamed protein product [Trichobilharzia regenti]|nr:unnamed protein product [Trichobilharzia regenti]
MRWTPWKPLELPIYLFSSLPKTNAIKCLKTNSCIQEEAVVSLSLLRWIPYCIFGTRLNCEYPVGIWSTWTLPSPCFPEDCGVTRYRWRRRYCLNGTTSEDLLPHMTESSQSSTELNGWTYSHRRMPIACPGTSEEVRLNSFQLDVGDSSQNELSFLLSPSVIRKYSFENDFESVLEFLLPLLL